MCQASYKRMRTRQQAYGTWQPRVPVEAAREHVERLLAAGLGPTQLATLTGLAPGTIHNLRQDDWHTVDAETETAILAVEIPEHPADVVDEHTFVPIIGAQRRIQALVAYGYPRSHLAAELGINPASSAMGALAGKPNASNGSTGEYIPAGRERAVRELFDRLQMVPGPSDRARNHGRRRGWPQPWEWDEDEIDRRDGRPASAQRTAKTDIEDQAAERAERDAAITALLRTHSAAEVADVFGISSRQVERVSAKARRQAESETEEVRPESASVETFELTEAI
ncbi:hypothetical protein ACTD5D_41135 [Nocardia takedensis]|uniref:hypothetical protein n=1 Tax=Nocardia takedensis TaxID=259390 RepID=UPI003F75EDD9